LVGRHLGQAEDAAAISTKNTASTSAHRPAPARASRSAHAAGHHQAQQQQHGQFQRAPVFGLRIAAHQDEAAFLGDHAPAGAHPRAAWQASASGRHTRMQHAPLHDAVAAQTSTASTVRERGQLPNAGEQVGAARGQAPAWLAGAGRGWIGRKGLLLHVAHRSLMAARR
jgi:hypothetical protein